MAWILQTDRSRPGAPRARVPAPEAVMRRGTLRVETTLPHPGTPAVLAGSLLDWGGDGPQTMAITVDTRGALVFVHEIGSMRRGLRLPQALAQEVTGSGGILRAVYAWDSAQAWLRVECPDRGLLAEARMSAPLPMSGALVETILQGGPRAVIGATVSALALADTVEPAGPRACLSLDAPVITDRGEIPLALLRPGHRVLTRDNGFQPVRRVVRRVAPTCGVDHAIRLRAPFGGLDCDLVVAAPHRVLFVGTEAEYLFGTEEVLIEAGHLGRGPTARPEPGLGALCLAQLVFDRHEIIRVGGSWSESLLQTAPDGRRTPARPLLSAFEAATLIAARASTASADAA